MSIELQTERLLLKTADRTMLEPILAFHIKNKDHLTAWESKTGPEYYTKAYQKLVIRSERHHLRTLQGIDFWLIEKHSNVLMGKVSVFGIIMGNYRGCTIGYKLDRDYVGCGYMQEALKEVIRFLFEELRLHRIEINILPRNQRSLNVVKHLGFDLECESREFMEVNGVWENHLRFIKLNPNVQP
ncbi:MAG: GNAT family N-acetyltransferase [Anaerofustis sp.]